MGRLPDSLMQDASKSPVATDDSTSDRATQPPSPERRRRRTVAGRRVLRVRAARLLEGSGVTLDGPYPWDIRVLDERFFARVFAQGSLGFGESYVDAWWDADDLEECMTRLVRHGVNQRAGGIAPRLVAWRHKVANVQRGVGAWKVGRRHYDLGDDLFEAMLGRRLVYSCAYWNAADDLDAAQEAKLDLVCRKLRLQPGMRVLDVGCGWGEALKYAAERYGATGVGVTISENQSITARRLCAGLPVEIRLADYRTLENESFDRIFSIGMFEHVGPHNHSTYFRAVRRCLAPDGLFLLHTIGTERGNGLPDPWIERYIFPNSAIPRLDHLLSASIPHFAVEDLHNFGLDYVRTLRAWRERFDEAWPQLEPRYGATFRRLWHYYLAASIASFRSRWNHLWQFVFAPQDRVETYRSVR